MNVAGSRGGATIASTGVMVQVEAGAGAVPGLAAASRTEIVKPYVPILVGVPLRMPVIAPMVIPAGRLPADTKNLYGGVPPDAVNTAGVTGTPTGEGGRTGPEIGPEIARGAGFTVNVRGAVTPLAFRMSVALTENVNVPGFVGVPEMTPVPEPIERPGGRLPLTTILHVYGGAPPVAVKAPVA